MAVHPLCSRSVFFKRTPCIGGHASFAVFLVTIWKPQPNQWLTNFSPFACLLPTTTLSALGRVSGLCAQHLTVPTSDVYPPAREDKSVPDLLRLHSVLGSVPPLSLATPRSPEATCRTQHRACRTRRCGECRQPPVASCKPPHD